MRERAWLKFTAARIGLGYQQDDVAKLLRVHKQTITDWESGKYPPATKHWEEIQLHLGIPASDITDHAMAFSRPK